MTKHPARYSDAVLDVFRQHLNPGDRVLDPMAGVGRLAEIEGIVPVMIEIEPEWATQIVGDALNLPFPDSVFDAIAVSPTYGNRMADHHDAKDDSVRHTYKHYLGRDLHKHNTGRMQWGHLYRVWHKALWAETVRTLAPGGDFLLNCSNHIRKAEEQPVTAWHVKTLTELGLMKYATREVHTPRLRHGDNHTSRVAFETVTVFRKGRS